jgi:peptide/nickel transport system ATP-binding protein
MRLTQKTADMTALLSIQNWHVHFETHEGDVHALRGINLDILQGRTLGLVGGSGSGKSQLFLSLFGLLARNGRSSGSFSFADSAIENPAQLLGRDVAFVFQDPLTSLTPHLRIGTQMAEALVRHEGLSFAAAQARCKQLLDQCRIPESARRLSQYPHELSGGMRQRVMIAQALSSKPKLLIADEPTTALDVTVQAQILTLLNDLQNELGLTIAFVSHDMGVMAAIADDIAVLHEGQIIERGTVADIFAQPKTPQTQSLINARKAAPAAAPASITQPILLSARDVEVQFPVAHGWFGKRMLRAVDGVGLDVHAGETLVVVGESGCGKSTLARACLGLIRTTAGDIRLQGRPIAEDVLALRRAVQIVFQDPFAALDPRMTVGQSVIEPLETLRADVPRSDHRPRAAALFEEVGLETAWLDRYPHELSGGQNQRVALARALIVEPQLLVCDEAISALDTATAAQVLALLKAQQAKRGLGILFITHDLLAARMIGDRVLTLYMGRVVELGPVAAVLEKPHHPYTKMLVAAAPVADVAIMRARPPMRMADEPPSPFDPAAALRFLPSRLAEPAYRPKLVEVAPGYFVAEHDEALL